MQCREKLRWTDVYREAELYKAAVRLYTRPLFNRAKALSTSVDQKTLHDFARKGLQNLHVLHRSLREQRFKPRPGVALHYNFNGRQRVLYIYPWEERLVDLLLYRLLNRRLHGWMSPHAYAYRVQGFSLDQCQRRIGRALQGANVFVIKRDITNYFASVDHDLLLDQLAGLVEPSDYLFRLLESRVRFRYVESADEVAATRGIPFGTAVACVLANVYLTPIDRRLTVIPGLSYFRYADDFLAASVDPDIARHAADEIDEGLHRLRLEDKPTHRMNVTLTRWDGPVEPGFDPVSRVRHLGLEFRADASIGLSRDKQRKICNLFRFALRRNRSRLRQIPDRNERIKTAVEAVRRVLDRGVRNVAIIDYYLRHVDDERQLRRVDRWLAEEVLSVACGGGHRKGHFRKLGYATLRSVGLPSLVHRRRLIRHGQIRSPFFVWSTQQISKSSGEAAARTRHARPSLRSQKQQIHSACERERLPVDGGY